MSNVVTLNDGDLMLARQIALMRTGLNRANEVKSNQFGDSNSWENEILGVLGEMAFGKRFNLYLDLSFNIRKGGSDFRARDGRTTDVKTTELEHGRLMVPAWKKDPSKKSDLYALVTGKFPTFTMRGYATHEQVFASPINNVPKPCFGLTQDQLTLFPNA